MGVFEFVLAIIFMSLVFKTINLRYESQKNNRTGGDANALGLNSAMEKQGQRVPKGQSAKGASGEAANASSRWLFLYWMACCFIPMALFLLWSLSYQPVAMQAVPAVPLKIHELPEAPPIPEAVLPSNATPRGKKQDEAPDEFLADVYPSIVDCAAPTAIKIYNEISDRLPTVSPLEAEDSSDEKNGGDHNKIAGQQTPEPTEFYITNGGLSEQDYVPFVVAFRKKIEAKVENSSVKDITGRALVNLKQPPKSHYRLVVSRIRKEINGEKILPAGQVVCKVKGKGFSTEVVTQYVQRLWLTDYEAFSKLIPGKQFAVGHDAGFFPNPSQAREQALKNAGVGATVDSVAGTRYAINGRMFQLSEEVCQKYERPYGDVFRCSVLLELDQDKLTGMVHGDVIQTRQPMQMRQPMQTSQPTLLSSLFDCGWKPSFEWSIALLIGLTVVIGTISNALTQGYYRTEISRSSMVIVAVGFIILLSIVIMTFA